MHLKQKIPPLQKVPYFDTFRHKRKIYIVLYIGQYMPTNRTEEGSIMTQEYKIDSAFIKEPWKKITYKEIEKLSSKKSRSYIYRALNRLISEEIIKKEEVGKTLVYETNLESLNARSYLGYLEEYNARTYEQIPSGIISKLSTLMYKVTPFFILLVTGSYAKGKQNKSSDLDVVIICDDSIKTKRIYAELQHESDSSIPKVHLYAFNRKDFLTMLTDEKENYGKEMARHHLIFAGGSNYYEILKEAIKRGFRG